MHRHLIFLFALLLFAGGCSGPTIDTTPDSASASVEAGLSDQPTSTEAAPASVQSDLDDLLIIGEAEYVYIGEEAIRLAARIDTGATTSSLGAKAIKLYESDGKKWVRFQVVEPRSGKQTTFRRPLKRTAEIKRHGAEKQKRYVVKLPIKLGPIDREIEFTLTDRSDFEFPVLIGRNFLKGVAVVDVDRKYSITPLAEQ